MDKNKIIILALVVIIAALLVGMAAMMMPNMGKQDTKLKFKGNSTLTEGDSLKVKLTDANGTAIANQTVNVTITDEDKSNSYYSVVTNENGVGKLNLDKDAGEYNVTVGYGGNDKYKGCDATKKITIEKEVIEAKSSSSSNTQSVYAYKSDGTPMYSQHEVNEYMSHKYGLCSYDIQPNGYIDLKHGEPGQYSTNWKDGIRENGLA